MIRSGGSLEVLSGTYGGTARLHVLGTLVLRNTGLGAATVLTRDCAYDPTPGGSYPGEEDCDPPATPPAGPTGVIEVDDGGVLDVLGGGVNLGDGYVVVVRGLMRVRTGAYVAADHGTGLELRPHRTTAPGTGTLRFEGDGGYLEGHTTADTGVATLSTLVNQGRIDKSGGTGRTLVAADYSQPAPGTVSARTGTLLLPTGPTTLATVQGGATYGTGRCVDATAPDCTHHHERGLPAERGTGRAGLRRLGGTGPGQPAAGSTHSSWRPGSGDAVRGPRGRARRRRDHPAVIRLRFDATVLDGKTWSDVRILRKAGTAPYLPVEACTAAGAPPAGQDACVDRNGTTSSSRDLPGGDVLMVIRAVQTSRWVGR